MPLELIVLITLAAVSYSLSVGFITTSVVSSFNKKDYGDLPIKSFIIGATFMMVVFFSIYKIFNYPIK